MPRQTSPEELTLFASAPEWTREFTGGPGGCQHQEVYTYKDGTVECSRCGICLPTNGTWAD
jgi:hypothetical protein